MRCGTLEPEADEQRCWNHKILNLPDQLPKAQRRAARPMLRAVAHAPSRKEAERQRKQFEAWCARKGLPAGCGDLGAELRIRW